MLNSEIDGKSELVVLNNHSLMNVIKRNHKVGTTYGKMRGQYCEDPPKITPITADRMTCPHFEFH